MDWTEPRSVSVTLKKEKNKGRNIVKMQWDYFKGKSCTTSLHQSFRIYNLILSHINLNYPIVAHASHRSITDTGHVNMLYIP